MKSSQGSLEKSESGTEAKVRGSRLEERGKTKRESL
jgi:hypothetical protein